MTFPPTLAFHTPPPNEGKSRLFFSFPRESHGLADDGQNNPSLLDRESAGIYTRKTGSISFALSHHFAKRVLVTKLEPRAFPESESFAQFFPAELFAPSLSVAWWEMGKCFQDVARGKRSLSQSLLESCSRKRGFFTVLVSFRRGKAFESGTAAEGRRLVDSRKPKKKKKVWCSTKYISYRRRRL